MRAKKIFEWSTPLGMIITVDHLMKWYGGKDWERDTDITDSMGVDGEHAQDTDETGQIWIAFLSERKHAAIEVDAIDEGNAIGVSFELDGHFFNFQADAFPFEDDLGNPIALGGYELDEKYRHPQYPALEYARFNYVNTLLKLDEYLIKLENSIPTTGRDYEIEKIVNDIRLKQSQLKKIANDLTIKLRLS